MTITAAQQEVLQHLRAAYMGPGGGEQETVFNGRPDLLYTVGMLYPPVAPDVADAGHDEGRGDGQDDDAGPEEDDAGGVPLAEDWRPSSVAISFVTDGAAVRCSVEGGTYEPLATDGPPQWQRTPFTQPGLTLSDHASAATFMAGGVAVEVGSRWRPFGSDSLVTVHVRLTSPSSGDAKTDAAATLYQLRLRVSPDSGRRILEYDPTRSLDTDPESAELRLRYRNRKVYAVGHGMAADWTLVDGAVTSVFLDPVPAFVVPAVETVAFEPGRAEAKALDLGYLAHIDSRREDVTQSLDAFVGAYGSWVAEQEGRVPLFGQDTAIASGIVERSRDALQRMRGAVDLLRSPEQDQLRTAFALGMAAMRLQMRQARIVGGADPATVAEPSWRPFQLGFILVALASTVQELHPDRELVDLVWFPTGGGKTEAYLGLAAIEIFRRRLEHGTAGGGTAVITRYTLRLLTAQQFQRASSLICAMELLRRRDRLADPRAAGMAPFTIGLWVGNEVTPGSRSEARLELKRLLKAARPEEANRFQVGTCPWCGTPLVPPTGSADPLDYGMRAVGKDVVIQCTRQGCEFVDELPVAVVDEVLYDQPPTFLLATVDKFARLQFKPEAGRLLGLGTAFRQPSMIIQDELHLLSGPLGTTVAVFDTALQLLLELHGRPPKIVASTATIRAAREQVQGLYGRGVALYPPSGLDDDRNFFSRPVPSGEGRLYVGLMPQSVSQASAVVAAAVPLLELPEVLAGLGWAAKDQYWTAVMYHHSLRELGRSATLVVDDVNNRMQARAERLSLPLRRVRRDRVVELTSRRGAEELPKDLRELGISRDDSAGAVDVVLSSNMLSVGIDVPRLALMLMVGQAKTTAEYIQATSRVGRGEVRGVVTTLFRSNRARDRSHFETFRAYHESLYRTVEPTSVTPWSVASRARSLAGALVVVMRHSFGDLSANAEAIRLDLEDERMRASVERAVENLRRRVLNADEAEADETIEQVHLLLNEWDRRASLSRGTGVELLYERRPATTATATTAAALLRRFDQPGEGWLVADSMRSVEPNVAVEVREPLEGKH
jgi:hypothetical protein